MEILRNMTYINIYQNNDLSIGTDADDEIKSLFKYSSLRNIRKQQDSEVNKIEKSTFLSTNSSSGWFDIAAYVLFGLTMPVLYNRRNRI